MKTRIDTSDPPNSPGRSHSAAAGACGRDGKGRWAGLAEVSGGGEKVGGPS